MILIDQDGPIADWETALYNSVCEQGDGGGIYAIPLADRRGFYAADDYEVRHGPSIREKVLDCIRVPGFYLGLGVVPGAIDALNKLAEQTEVRICTAPSLLNPTCASDKLAWIDRNLGRKWVHRTIITRDKTFVRGDVLLDDKDEVTGSLVPTWRHVIYDMPYNRHVSGERITWNEYESLL